ncbi:MAG: NAD(P)H-hydrate dehydratase, partial [Muribaculaceae bacterium]
IKETATDYYLVENYDVKRVLKKRKAFSNKYDFGSTMIIAGSYGMIGAAVLSARAAMRAGAGLVTVHAPRCGYSTIQGSVP